MKQYNLEYGDMLQAAYDKPGGAKPEAYKWVKKAVAKITYLGGHLNGHNIASHAWRIYKEEKKKKSELDQRLF